MLTIIVTVLVALVVINYLMSPSVPVQAQRHRVTPQMIDAVQQIGPGLTREQIEYDLQRTGNVNVTVDRYLDQGSLPFPPTVKKPEVSKVEATADVTGGPFGGLSFAEKRQQMVESSRKALAAKEGMSWEKVCEEYGL